MNPMQRKWDEIYQKTPEDFYPEPSHVLRTYDYLLPAEGLAVDLACGLGGNALFLAERGFKTRALDLSPVAIDRLNRIARKNRLRIECEIRDLENSALPHAVFDVVVVTRYLDRNLSHGLINALRPGGLLYFQTFIRDKDPAVGPGNPEHLLAENELAKMFSKLLIRAYHEAGRIGDLSRGFRNEAFLVAQKPAASRLQ